MERLTQKIPILTLLNIIETVFVMNKGLRASVEEAGFFVFFFFFWPEPTVSGRSKDTLRSSTAIEKLFPLKTHA